MNIHGFPTRFPQAAKVGDVNNIIKKTINIQVTFEPMIDDLIVWLILID